MNTCIGHNSVTIHPINFILSPMCYFLSILSMDTHQYNIYSQFGCGQIAQNGQNWAFLAIFGHVATAYLVVHIVMLGINGKHTQKLTNQ